MFQGSMAALVTPFKEDGAIDFDALQRIVDHQIDNGTSAVVPCGSTGESATMSHGEHIDVIRAVVKAARGRVPVIAGTGSNSTAESISLTKAAKEIGATAVLLISPYYNKPTQEGIYRHYEKIAREADVAMIVYNIPGRTGSKIEAKTIARLAELDQVIGLKEATGSLDEVQEVYRLCGQNIEIYSGDDSLTLPVVAVGGVGVISVIANIAPRLSADMVAAALRGDYKTARELSYRMLPLIRTLFLETNPIPVKAAMSMLGFCRDDLRLPLLPMSDAPRATLREAMKTAGLL